MSIKYNSKNKASWFHAKNICNMNSYLIWPVFYGLCSILLIMNNFFRKKNHEQLLIFIQQILGDEPQIPTNIPVIQLTDSTAIKITNSTALEIVRETTGSRDRQKKKGCAPWTWARRCCSAAREPKENGGGGISVRTPFIVLRTTGGRPAFRFPLPICKAHHGADRFGAVQVSARVTVPWSVSWVLSSLPAGCSLGN